MANNIEVNSSLKLPLQAVFTSQTLLAAATCITCIQNLDIRKVYRICTYSYSL